MPNFSGRYIAKTYELNENIVKGRDVLSHCQIVGSVAKALLEQMETYFKSFFHEGVPLLAAIHDNGKISPTFQEKLNRSVKGYEHNSALGLENADPELERNWGGHAGTGFATLEYMIKRLPDRRSYKNLPYIVGIHHGGCAKISNLACDEVFGGMIWNDERINLINNLKAFFKTDLPPINDELSAKLAAGLTVVSDWIGSGSLFDDPNEDWEDKINTALNSAGFRRISVKQGLSFSDIFGFEPRDAQKKLIEACCCPGIYVLEAPMGIGKTEAALYCAYKMLEKGLSRGIYFALPTQITSNKIYDRFRPFIEKISSEREDARLVHSNALFYEMGAEASPGQSWFSASKRGLLAPFAVGTIDQALMAVMNVRHSSVRAFGLFGKTVILDEVHAYDAYTGTILNNLVKDLHGLGCTVIILSATLTKSRREEIAGIKPCDNSYPLITSVNEGRTRELSISHPESALITLEQTDFDLAIEEAVAAAKDGQQVLWIENTVEEAQDAFRALASAGDFECGLIHSRFLKQDRFELENKWVKLYGKDNTDRYLSGRVLVGTQVLEQSLDLDADLLITRLAPIDFLLQRMGRLWRHDIKRHKNAKRRCIILPVDDLKKNSGLVYSPYVIERTRETLSEKSEIVIPDQIRELVEQTYSERDQESEIMIKYKNELQKKKDDMQRFALKSLSKISESLPDTDVSTRYSELDSVILLLVKRFEEGRIFFTDGTVLDIPAEPLNYAEKCNIVAEIDKHTLPVPKWKAPERNLLNLNRLKKYTYIDESFIVAALGDDRSVMTLDRRKENSKYDLYYYSNLGYVTKNNGE